MKKETKYEHILPQLRQFAGQKTSYEIAAELGVSRSYLLGIALSEGISLKLKRNEEKRKQIIEAIKKYGHSHTAWKIAKMFKTYASEIKRYADKEGLSVMYQQGKGVVKAKNSIVKEIDGFFRVNEYSNWLVG